MTTSEKKHIPWRTVWVLTISSNISWGSIYYAFSVLQIPMQQELGWTKVALTGAQSFGLVISALTIVPVGYWIDRKGGRVVMGLGSLLAAAMLYAWSDIHTLPMYYVLFGGMGLVMSMVLYDAAFSVINAVCEASAHTAIVIVTLGGGMASTVFYPLTQYLIDILSWRQGLVVLALLNLGVCFPLHVFGLPRHSAESHLPPPAQAKAVPGEQAVSGIRDALSSPIFWLVAVAFTASTLILSAMATHLIPLLLEKGLTTDKAVLVAAMVGPMQVFGRLLQLFRGRWFTPERFGTLIFALFPMALSILVVASSGSILLFAFSMLYGVANGMITILRGTTIPAMFGRKNYGRLNGLLAAPNLLARAVGPIAASLIWVAADGYGLLLWCFIAIGATATIVYWWAVVDNDNGDTSTARVDSPENLPSPAVNSPRAIQGADG
ncbi:MFS transporter [Azonexus sp.]|jgi:MFS family permease|uniref:MFS transporter n=1 Tax=Azonexus sp. TaxID=1872668 RepID=UPI00281975D2|nr:MFS transporter [Azonexus sp.]MDR1995203.1 MFS transporter [Azonexus sp.]